MKRVAGLLIMVLGACSREPPPDPIVGPDAHIGSSRADGSSDATTQVMDAAAPPPGPDTADASRPDPDVGSPDVGAPDLGAIDAIGALDVGRVSDGRVSDRCGSLYRADIPLALGAIAADDAGGLDATDASAKDVADRDADQRVDADARDATFDEICSTLEVEFRAFVQQNNTCNSASDCMIVIGVRDCSCTSRGIGQGSGSAVSVSVSAEAQSYVARWSAAGCESWRAGCLQDTRPSDSVTCIQGKCVANNPFCFLPPPPEPRPEPCQ